MYCHNCGCQLSESANYCTNCGALQSKEYTKLNKARKRWKIVRRIFVMVFCVPLIVLGILVLIAGLSEENIVDSVKPNNTQIPENGWYNENGNKYYFIDGKMCVDLHEINDSLYYFYDDGRLAVDTDVHYDGCVLEVGSDGQVNGIIYDIITGEWSDESYRFDYGGSSSILELDFLVENCDYMTFYLEANGKYGAKVNGNWKFYIRKAGEWEFINKFEFSEPSGEVKIYFDSPVDFDAITAHPTVQGNASYSSLFYLKSVHCFF